MMKLKYGRIPTVVNQTAVRAFIAQYLHSLQFTLAIILAFGVSYFIRVFAPPSLLCRPVTRVFAFVFSSIVPTNILPRTPPPIYRSQLLFTSTFTVSFSLHALYYLNARVHATRYSSRLTLITNLPGGKSSLMRDSISWGRSITP